MSPCLIRKNNHCVVVILVGLVVLVLGADAAAVQSLRRVLDVTTITCNNLCFAANDGICEVGFFFKIEKIVLVRLGMCACGQFGVEN